VPPKEVENNSLQLVGGIGLPDTTHLRHVD
jgi:hypothetical protein